MQLLRKRRKSGSAGGNKVIWARVQMLWVDVRDSLWFVPAALTLTGALAAVVLVQVDKQGGVTWTAAADRWLMEGDADGARQLLSAIVGGLMTVTGVAFSVTIVALQLASSQFTPRVLRNFTADRTNQIVLGVLIGTFTYAMLVLRTVRSAGPGTEEFVPRLAVAVGVGLALISIGWLIYFINHAASSMRIAIILDRVTKETLIHIRRYYPAPFDPRRDDGADAGARVKAQGCSISAGAPGYLQAIDSEALAELARRNNLEIQMACHVGQFLLTRQPMAYVFPPEAVDDRIVDAVRDAFVLGNERTPEQDVEFGIIEISDIAVKALSPGINDPTTAMRCIDRLTQLLQELGTRHPPPVQRTEQGLIPFTACYLHFERAVGLAFDQVRHFGAGNPAIAKKLIDALALLVGLLPSERHSVLIAQADAVLADARSATTACTQGRDFDEVEKEFRAVCDRATNAGNSSRSGVSGAGT